MQTRDEDAALEAPHLPRPKRQSRLWRWAPAVGAVALLVGWVVWYVTTPEDLPTDPTPVTAAGVVGQPLYVGMFAAPGDFQRTLHMSGVIVHADSSDKKSLTIKPLLCRHGAFGQTTEPDQFCASLDSPAGQRLGPGDSIVLEISSDTTVVAKIDPIKISFQEGFRWGTKAAGHPAEVSLLPRGGQ